MSRRGLCGFSEGMGVCSSLKVEIKAIHRGLRLVKSMKIPKLGVQLDSLVVAGMLRDATTWNVEHEPLLCSYVNLIHSGGWEVKVTYYYRETNQVADKLANMGTALATGCNILNSPPGKVRDAILVDNVQTVWPRIIRK